MQIQKGWALTVSLVGVVGCGVVGCGGGSSGPTAAELVQRCVTACTRTNAVCASSNDCNATCGTATTPGNVALAARCGNEAATAFACVEGLSDASVCDATMFTPSSPCYAERIAVLSCQSASADAGVADAGH